MSIQELVITVLTITNFPEKDRQSFSDKLLSYAGQLAFLSYIKELPKEKQEEIEEQQKEKSPEELETLYKNYLNEDAYKKYFAQEVDRCIAEYIEEVAPEITEEQKKKLEELYEKFPHEE